MALVLFGISTMMILGAILTSPKLERMGVRHSARYSFAAICILVAIYLGWIGSLFWKDLLGPENYTAELIGVRILLLLASAHFLWAIWRCE